MWNHAIGHVENTKLYIPSSVVVSELKVKQTMFSAQTFWEWMNAFFVGCVMFHKYMDAYFINTLIYKMKRINLKCSHYGKSSTFKVAISNLYIVLNTT